MPPLRGLAGDSPFQGVSKPPVSLVVMIVVDNKVPGDPPEALASWEGGVMIVVDNKVPGDPPEALASWEGGVLITNELMLIILL